MQQLFRVFLPCVVLSAGAFPGAINEPILKGPVMAALDTGSRVSLADLDRDGVLDLVSSKGIGSPVVSLLGNGDGTFTPQSFFVAGGLSDLPPILADLTGDGVPDFLGPVGLGSGFVQLRAGLGDGSFGPATALFPGVGYLVPALGDIDGDGDLDVVISATEQMLFDPGVIHQLINDGTGQLSEAGPPLPLDESLVFLEVADLNLDGLADLVHVGGVSTSVLRVRYGLGPLTYAAPVTLAALPDQPFTEYDIQLADFEGDGDLDIALFDELGSQVHCYTNPGDGSAFVSTVIAVPEEANRFLLADVSGNGSMDLLLSDDDGGVVHLSSNGLFSVLITVDGLINPELRVAGDVNGDGRQDILLRTEPFPQCLAVLINGSYVPGSPFSNLGGGLGGSATGTPILELTGQPVAGAALAFSVSKTSPGTPVWFVLGLAVLQAPFKGGLLVPRMDLLLGPVPADNQGESLLSGTWPGGLAGLPVWVQSWLQDASGPVGFTGTPTTSFVAL